MPNIKSFDESAKNSNALSVEFFSNGTFGEIKVIIRNDEPWFVGREIATILGYTNTNDAINSHVDSLDKEMIQLSDIQDPRVSLPSHMKGSKVVIINESGLYSLILSSKLESAKEFKLWITREVLPSIRRTGHYSVRKGLGNQSDYINGFNAFMEGVRKNLRISDASAANMYNKIANRFDYPEVEYVPSKGVKFSATFLLNKFGRKETIHEFNRKMEEKGFLETRTRPSSKGTKRFKSLTEKGLEFGENMVSPKNEKETQPHYYEDKFEALMAILFL